MKNRKTRAQSKPSGISEAALEGAREGDQSPHPGQDAKTVQPKTENNEAPLGGGTVAFPAPSAQPTNRAVHEPTSKPAEIDTSELEDDDDAEWRRAGGGEGE